MKIPGLIRRMTLRKRLTVLILLSVFLVMSLGGLIRIGAVTDNIRSSMAQKIEMTLELAAGSLVEPLWSYNDNALKAICDTFFKDREIVQIVVSASNGAVLYERRLQLSEYDPEKLIIVERSVFKQNALIGKVSVGITTYYREVELTKEILYTGGSIVLICCILWMLIMFVSRMVTKPVYELIAGTETIAEGDFSKRLPSESEDEIGRLAGKFNLMAEKLQEMMRELREQNKMLVHTSEVLSQSEERFRTVVTSTPIIIYALDNEGVFTLSEGLGLKKLGLEPGQVVGLSVYEVYRDYPDILESIRKAFAGEAEFFEHSVGGTYFDNRMVPLYDEAQKLKGLIGVALDITERVHAEEKLQRSHENLTATHEELRANEEELRGAYSKIVAANTELTDGNEMIKEIFNAANDIIVVIDAENGKFLTFNRRASELLGYTREELEQYGLSAVLAPEEMAEGMSSVRRTVTEGPQAYERKLFDRYGRVLYFEIRTSPVTIHGKNYSLAVLRDNTARRQMEEHVEFLLACDPMTGAFNRAHFETEMLKVQTGLYQSVGVFVCDVDGLKMINDTLGHRQGDILLKRVATLLQEGVREPDLVARIGGDEFAVILFGATAAKMEAMDDYYQKQVEQYNAENPQLPLSLSFGRAIDTNVSNIEKVFKEADNNMYRQKMHQQQSVRGSIVQMMMKALEARDHITEGHADRLGELMEKMGKKMGFAQADLSDLRLFANFHDIGKVGIPDSILKKPGKLTLDEMAIMRQHCEIGFRIAKASPDLSPIADWILKHQEHWNGKGYPLGISGEDIPVACRIIAIVDAYDAMTNDRPYRKAIGHEAAIAEIRRFAGTQFDPNLAQCFFELAESGLD